MALALAHGEKYLSPPNPNSDKFRASVGIGAFKNFNNVSRAGDVTKVCVVVVWWFVI